MTAAAADDTTPPPTFDVLPLSPEVRRGVDELGYVHPTPVQRAVFEPAARGRDLVVQARTGTGKTAAFGLPIIDVLVRRATPAVQSLVLCPTRELALQVCRELEALAKYRSVHSVPIYGGAPMPRQIAELQTGAQIVVGTPGRVLDHLERKTFEPSAVRVLVLDESDEMLSMGFLPQINQILGYLPENRQTLLFSATLPRAIQRMAETRLRNPEFITLSGDHIGALEIQHFVYLSRSDKLAELVQMLEIENPEGAIVFCNTRDETKRVATALRQQGYSADWLNADLSQSEREQVMARTRRGDLRLLVATDVAARGIDISHLTHVVNFDFPETAESYVHRTGRTGRAGRTGTAISLIEGSDIGNLYLLRLTYKIRPIEKQLPSVREMKTRAEADLVEMFVDLFAQRRTHPDDVSLARRLLTHEAAENVVAGLLRDHLGARPEAQELATAARRARPPSVVETEPDDVDGARAPLREPPEDARQPLHDLGQPAEGTGQRAADKPSASPHAVRRTQMESSATPHEVRRPQMEPSTTPHEVQRTQMESSATPHEVRRPQMESPRRALREGLSEIFVSLGRRDGVTPEQIRELLDTHGLSDGTDYVNVRHRHTFVAVRTEELSRALEALNGATLAGRKATAEPSRSTELRIDRRE